MTDSTKIGIVAPQAAEELRRASTLRDAGFVTEAVLRIGRSVESALYAVASAVDLSLKDRTIEVLAVLQRQIEAAETIQLRNPAGAETKQLAEVAKQLSLAIGTLAESADARLGTSCDRPRASEAILREIVQLSTDDALKRKLGRAKELLRTVQVRRNDAAHASLEGIPREVTHEQYEETLKYANEVLELLADTLLGIRASKRVRQMSI